MKLIYWGLKNSCFQLKNIQKTKNINTTLEMGFQFTMFLFINCKSFQAIHSYERVHMCNVSTTLKTR